MAARHLSSQHHDLEADGSKTDEIWSSKIWSSNTSKTSKIWSEISRRSPAGYVMMLSLGYEIELFALPHGDRLRIRLTEILSLHQMKDGDEHAA